MGGFNWNKFGRDIQGGLEDFGKDLGNSLNPINTIGKLSGNIDNGINTIGGVVNKTIGTVSSLIDFLPLILIAGGALFILTKK